MSAAHGGQVVLSAATERLVSGVALRDLGEHRLRDLDRAEHLYQVLGDGLVTEFPPLRGVRRACEQPVDPTDELRRTDTRDRRRGG